MLVLYKLFHARLDEQSETGPIRNPESLWLEAKEWIPAFAGMTKLIKNLKRFLMKEEESRITFRRGRVAQLVRAQDS